MTIRHAPRAFGPATSKAQRARVRQKLCELEMATHREVIDQLEWILSNVLLDGEQARQVRYELATRHELVAYARQVKATCFTLIWRQQRETAA